MIELKVKVLPSSSRDCIAGWLGESLKIKVQAPPENGKANRAVLKNLAKWLGVPAGAVKLVSGQTRANKVVTIEGISREELDSRLGLLPLRPGPETAT